MRILSLMGIVLLAAAGTANASDMDVKEANQAIMLCHYKAAMELDDGVSDVSSLAAIVADWCLKESDRLDRVLRSRINGPIDEQMARRVIREKDLRMASRIILMKRADDRKESQQK